MHSLNCFRPLGSKPVNYTAAVVLSLPCFVCPCWTDNTCYLVQYDICSIKHIICLIMSRLSGHVLRQNFFLYSQAAPPPCTKPWIIWIVSYFCTEVGRSNRYRYSKVLFMKYVLQGFISAHKVVLSLYYTLIVDHCARCGSSGLTGCVLTCRCSRQ